VRAAGFKVTICLVDLGETAETTATAALSADEFDCVLMGAGLRDRLTLFEKILNVVHTLAPRAKICFNTTPADSLEAIQRWVPPC
jgi:hypothetical protein